MKPRIQKAFTLVELLVVITIIGMLVALLLPAVNNARKAAQSTQCQNNLSNYAKALQAYVVRKEYFPGYRQALAVQTSSGSARALTSWQVALLPDMEKSDVYQALQNGAMGVQPPPSGITYKDLPYLEFAVCPSDNTVVGKGSPATSYVANSGLLDKFVSSQVGVAIKALPELESASNGLFHDKVLGAVKVSLTDIKDGAATTLMLSENVEANWYNNSPVTLLNSTNGNVDAAADCTERGAGFIWWDNAGSTAPPNTVARINGTVANGAPGDYDPTRAGWPSSSFDTSLNPPPSNTNYAARPSSNHSGGANVAFAAANVRFLREDIDYAVYCLLMTPNGAKATYLGTTNWQKNAPLNEGSY